ncbi:MAG: B12-binding domain-containing radical SAM protein [Planctomycetota bacterium]
MLTLVNTNMMLPAIGPIGLDYVAGAVQKAGFDVEILDLALTDEPVQAMKKYFSKYQPELIGVSFRNVDDCFWPSADWFVPQLKNSIKTIKSLTDAPIVIGGVGFSIFGESILNYTAADFGIGGDGESAIIEFMRQLQGKQVFSDVPGLLRQENGKILSNRPSWPDSISLATSRDFIDNRSYFKRGGQCGLETKRGCNRRCIYCADPLAKGSKLRLRKPSEVADEVKSLLQQGIDVLHFCDSEFNIPRNHAYAVCEEFNRHSLGSSFNWYAYLSPVPFDAELAGIMAEAGCVGIDFTGDSGCESMLQTYRQKHTRENLAAAVKLCRAKDIAVMIDLLLGGPGETAETVEETVEFIKRINPDCAGAALGIRIYPGTEMETIAGREIQGGKEGNIRRKYSGHIDLFQPTFYISEALGDNPAELVRDLIVGDERFFEPEVESEFQRDGEGVESGYNYNKNKVLVEAIEKGARGAYWDILRRLRKGEL